MSINFGSALGLTTAILGTAFSIALLVAKTVSQPPGIAITDPQKIVRAVDVFVLLANFTIVVAHFIGVLTCLWILNRIYRLGSGMPDCPRAATALDSGDGSDHSAGHRGMAMPVEGIHPSATTGG